MYKRYWEKNKVGNCDLCGKDCVGSLRRRFEAGVNMLGEDMPPSNDDKALVSLCEDCFKKVLG